MAYRVRADSDVCARLAVHRKVHREYNLIITLVWCTYYHDANIRTEYATSSADTGDPLTSPTTAVGRARATAGTPDGGGGTYTELYDGSSTVEVGSSTNVTAGSDDEEGSSTEVVEKSGIEVDE